MLLKRIIPCLDIAGGRVVKGVHFQNLRDMGDPIELACRYRDEGADELAFLDINASVEHRGTLLDLVQRVAEVLFIPFTVGGGVRSLADMDALLRAGADKIALNTAAVADPSLVQQAARQFGAQFIMVSVDTAKRGDEYMVITHGGRKDTPLQAFDWARRCVELGAGEILLNVIDADGTRNGFALDLTSRIAAAVTVPVIASGGAGSARDFVDVFTTGKADAALAAGIFHSGDVTISAVKRLMAKHNIPVRL